MLKKNSSEELKAHAAEVTAQLIEEVKVQQSRRGLTDVEVANRCGIHRATVGRTKREGDPQLSSFVAIAAAVGLSVTFKGKDKVIETAPEQIVHRGLSHFRTKGDEKYGDSRREKALAEAWEAANEENITSGPLLRDLVPGFTQEQATAAATVIQWLGSEVGFLFLEEALKKAKFEIIPA